MADSESKAKDSKSSKSKRIDPTVEEEKRRPAGNYVVNPIQIKSGSFEGGPAVVLKPGHLLKGELSDGDIKRAIASGDVEELR